jgi:hypothetical protein
VDESTIVATRTSLHAVAEALLAGPQYREHGTIRLRATPGGFGQVKGSWRVEGAALVGDGVRVALSGTIASVAHTAGIDAGVPDSYADHASLPDGAALAVDDAAAGLLADWYARGDAALRAFAPDVEPVLWPEHLDLAIAVDEVNYGISAGDGGHQAPYAYVGPWTPREGPFWNASFGALRAATELPDADAVRSFFAEGRAAL